MTFPPATPPRVNIDMAFLLRQVTSLADVKRKRRTWNEFGEKAFQDLDRASPGSRRLKSRIEPDRASAASYWGMVKELVHAVVGSRDPAYDGIRRRLGDLREPSTPLLLSTLSLWLAGVLGISVSVTGPLVAVMLYGVAEAGGDWEILKG